MAKPALQRAAEAATTAREAHGSSNAPKEKPTAGEQRFVKYYEQQHLVDDLPQLLAALRKPLPITFRIFDATRDGTSARLEAEAKGEEPAKREKRRKRDPFAKVRAARDAAAAERQQRRDDAEKAKKKALERRKKKAAQMRSAPGRLRGQLDDVLAKLEGEERR